MSPSTPDHSSPLCPPLAELERFVADDPALRELAGHVAACPNCSNLTARLRENNNLLAAFSPRGNDDSQVASLGLTPDAIPGCQLTGEIHRGGQGVVYQAVQQSTRRRVAVKVMREGAFASEEEKVRFEREVRILSQLKHPNIVAIHDSGQVAGRAYYVMDYIPGKRLDEYMAAGNVPQTDALRLFAQICEAVNVAHLRGVIHRDLKPGNIRVDPSGQPHILDFGLAKVSEFDTFNDTRTPAMTLTGQFIGSLPWASPEQAEGRQQDVDTRTDVYALGVILYQMLTNGEFPYEVAGRMRDVMDRIIRAEPVRPGARHKGIDNEIETITLKCLQKERDRRYQTAGELARDVRRYLAGEPIEAKCDSVAYLLRKQFKRHKLPVAVAAGFVLLVTVGFFVSLAFWRQAAAERTVAQRQQTRAEQALAEVEQQKAEIEIRKTEAERERDVAQAINDFINDDLLAAVAPADPDEAGRGRDVRMRAVLDEAARRIAEAAQPGGRFADKPQIEAAIRKTLGNTYTELGEYAAAEPHLRRAFELSQTAWGAEHPNTLTALSLLAHLCADQDRLDEAESFYDRLLAARRRVLGAAAAPTLSTMSDLATVYEDQGQYEKAEALYQETLEIERRRLGTDHPNTLSTMSNLGRLYYYMGRYEKAAVLLAAALEGRRQVHGIDAPETLNTLGVLAAVRLNQNHDEAAVLFEQVFEIQIRVLGPEHPKTLSAMGNLALAYIRQGRHGEAEPLLSQALATAQRTLGEEHSDTLNLLHNLAGLYCDWDRFAEAEPLVRAALAGRSHTLPPGHPSILSTRILLSRILVGLENYAEAESLLLETWRQLEQNPQAPRPLKRSALVALVQLYQAYGKPQEAVCWRAVAAELFP